MSKAGASEMGLTASMFFCSFPGETPAFDEMKEEPTEENEKAAASRDESEDESGSDFEIHESSSPTYVVFEDRLSMR